MKLRCNKCGFEKESSGQYEDYDCPLCNGLMQQSHIQLTDSKLNKQELSKICDIWIEQGMKQNIETLGNDRVWYMIERNFNQVKTRLAYRKYFFKAGGLVPAKEID